MNKKVIVKQNGYKDCGPSCLLSIMKYYGLEASHEEVSYILKTNIDGTNAYNIINGSRSFGFDGYGIHYAYEEIINNQITLPIICHVLKNGMYHFIVVYESNKDYLLVMDPSSNETKISKESFRKKYLGTSLVIYPIKEFAKIKKHKSLLNFIIDYIKLERTSVIKIIVLSLITILLGILSNYYTLICLDIILPKYELTILMITSIIFLISFLIKNILTFIRSKYLIKIEKNISLNINNDVIRKFFNLPYQFFKNKSIGESLSRLDDLKYFKELFTEIIVNISSDIILIIISMIILLMINYKLFIINLIELVLYFLIVVLFKKTFSIKTENLLVKESEYNKCLNESINGYEINKNLNMIDDTIKKIEIKYISYLDKMKSYQSSLNKQLIIKDILVSITYIISIFISIKFVHKDIISIGEFVLYNTIVYYFSEPVKNILDLEPKLNYLKGIYNRINDLLMMKENNQEISNYQIKEDIKIIDLSYSHDGLNDTFNNVTFNIEYGSKYLIYGNSGNGKSTIMKIVLKYLNDYKGNIFLGNINLKDISSNNIANNFTYVSQNSYVNNDTLKKNIIMNRSISEDEYEKVINMCNLNELRDSKKLRNNFYIEDDGFNISGGERQKIILARSLLKKSNYIILDEALSEVGLKEEKEILKKIFDYFKDKTIICISHKKEIIDMFGLKYKLERRSEVNVK